MRIFGALYLRHFNIFKLTDQVLGMSQVLGNPFNLCLIVTLMRQLGRVTEDGEPVYFHLCRQRETNYQGFILGLVVRSLKTEL